MRAHWDMHYVHFTQLMNAMIYIVFSAIIRGPQEDIFPKTTACPRVQECPREYLWKSQAVQNCEHLRATMECQNLFLKWLVDQGIENFQILQIPKTSPEMNRLARGRVRVRRGVHSFEQRRRYRHQKTRIPLRPKSQILIESQRIAIELQIRAHM